jgi:hypothetical protein
MATTWTAVRDAIEAKAEEMTVANGYNYNWTVGYRTDRRLNSGAMFFISLKSGEGGETLIESLDERNDISAGQGYGLYDNARSAQIELRVASQATIKTYEKVYRDSENALEKAKNDVLKRFSKIEKEICGMVYFQFGNLSAIKEETSKWLSPYYYRIDTEIQYRQAR